MAAENPGDRIVARGRHGELTLDEIADLLPGGAALMDLLGRRYWVMYYAAMGGNWDLARYEWRESVKILQAMAKVRPKYAADLAAFEAGVWAVVGKALDAGDFGAFDRAYREGIDASDTYHEKYAKAFIRFRLPDHPPEWLDVTGVDSRRDLRNPAVPALTVGKSLAIERMNRALDLAKWARDAGRDVTEVRKLLKQAREAFENQRWEEAVRVSTRILDLLGAPHSR